VTNTPREAQHALASQELPRQPRFKSTQTGINQADTVETSLKSHQHPRDSVNFARLTIAHFPPAPKKPTTPSNMAPPTPLSIATQAVNRLIKEEAYYHKEQASQEKRIAKLEEDIKSNSADLDSNAEYILKQEVGRPTHPLANNDQP
jgi:hypothetical protein